MNAPQTVEQWEIFELELSGPATGNPYLDVDLEVEFRRRNRSFTVRGFYDGDGLYRARCMPDVPGDWSYRSRSNAGDLDGAEGTFRCTPAGEGNHGPVRVAHRYHFAYADGTPYKPVGTTCYGWNHQAPELQEETLATLAASPFNKLRMCVPPKWYLYNRREPVQHPFQAVDGAAPDDEKRDFDRPNPAFFRQLEGQLGRLRELGIEADLILFHTYDKWGYEEMAPEQDDRYLRYVVARLAAYRNLWWSLANEYDLLPAKERSDWDRFFRIIQAEDPYQHLRSIHNCRGFYDHGQPWVTHCSIQRRHLWDVAELRETYGKPVVIDECGYEGDITRTWGCLSARYMVHQFWLSTKGGGYGGHGETYRHPDDILWWSHGGQLHGESPARIAFLRGVLEAAPDEGLEPIHRYGCGRAGEYYLFYWGDYQPTEWPMELPEDREFTVEVLDTWEMTVTTLSGTVSGAVTVELPRKAYQALRVQRVR